jgi:hypothetical protein
MITYNLSLQGGATDDIVPDDISISRLLNQRLSQYSTSPRLGVLESDSVVFVHKIAERPA